MCLIVSILTHFTIFLPLFGTIPCSKVIEGELKVETYTLQSHPPRQDGAQLSKRITSAVKTSADESWFLTSKEENIHQFTAMSNCVIFDCILPPYLEPERPCNYFELTEDSLNQQQCWLRQIEGDDSKLPYSIPYNGYKPKIAHSE